MESWTFLRDVGIASAVIIVLGRAMWKLAQTYSEFASTMREDNQQRNAQINTLLDINQSIAEQMALTRSSLEHLAQQGAAQGADLLDLQQGVTAVPVQLHEELEPLGASLRDVVQAVEALDGKLVERHQQAQSDRQALAEGAVQQLSTQLEATHTDIVADMKQALLPLLEKLDSLDGQIRQTRQDIAALLAQPARPTHP